MFGSKTVAQYDVGFNVLLGPFRAQLGEAAGTYGRTIGQMSTESLKLATRQADLAKAIERYGAESTQAARKTIALRDEMARLAAAQNETAAASEKANVSLLSQERTVGRLARGGAVGSGLGRSGLLFGSGAFIGGLALATVLKTTLDAAKNNEVAQAQLQVALENSGLAWERNKASIDQTLQSLIKTTAFTQTDLTTALANNVRRFGDLSTAIKATQIDADVARAKNMSLADAQNIVQRASLGQSRSLLALGIVYTKTTANVEALKAETKHATAEQLANAKAADAQANRIAALAAVDAKFHGNAAKFLTTSAGKQALFNAELKRSEEIIGQALLPEFNRLITRLSDYLDRMNRTGRLQHDVNVVMKDAGAVFHIAGEGIHALEIALTPVEALLHGTENTIRLLTAALIAFKLRGAVAFVQGSREIGDASVLAAGEVNGLTAAEGRAAAGAAGIGLAGAGASGVVGRVGMYTGAGAAAGAATSGTGFVAKAIGFAASAFVLGDIGAEQGKTVHLGGPLDVVVSSYPGGKQALVYYRDPITGKGHVLKLSAGANIGKSIAADIQKRYPGLGSGPAPTPAGRGDFPPTVPGSPPRTVPNPQPHQLILGLTEAQQTALLRAEGTPGTADDVKALNAQLAILNRLIQQKGLNAQQLNALLSARNSVLSQLDSLTAKVGAAANKAQTAADRLFRHQESLLKDALAKAKQSGGQAAVTKAAQALLAFYKKEETNPALSQATQDAARAHAIALQKTESAVATLLKHRESVLKLAVEKAKLTSTTADDIAALKKLEAFYKKEASDPRLSQAIRDTFKAKDVAEQLAIKKLTKAQTGDTAKNEAQFLATFRTIVESYAPNAFPVPAAKRDPDIYQLVHETREQTRHIKTLVKHTAFPASGYSVATAGAAYG